MQCATNSEIYWKNFYREQAALAEMTGVEECRNPGDEYRLVLIRSRQDGGSAIFRTAYDEYWTARLVSSDWQTGPPAEPTAKWGQRPAPSGETVYRDASSGAAVAFRWIVKRLDSEALAKKRRQLEDHCRKDQHHLVQVLSRTGLI